MGPIHFATQAIKVGFTTTDLSLVAQAVDSNDTGGEPSMEAGEKGVWAAMGWALLRICTTMDLFVDFWHRYMPEEWMMRAATARNRIHQFLRLLDSKVVRTRQPGDSSDSDQLLLIDGALP